MEWQYDLKRDIQNFFLFMSLALSQIGETLQIVLGSGENGSISTGTREHGAKKTREQVAKESNLGSMEQKIMGIVSNNLTQYGHSIKQSDTILRILLCLASSGYFSDIYFVFPSVINHIF